MGADFLFAVLPKCKLTPERQAEAVKRIARLKSVEFDDRMIERHSNLRGCKKRLLEILGDYPEYGQRRSVSSMQLDGGPMYFITGGDSWGDSPTKACDDFWDIDSTPIYDLLHKWAIEDVASKAVSS